MTKMSGKLTDKIKITHWKSQFVTSKFEKKGLTTTGHHKTDISPPIPSTVSLNMLQ